MRTIFVIYFLLTGPYCVDRAELRPIIREHRQHFQEIGVNIIPRRIYVRADAPVTTLVKNRNYRFSSIQFLRWELSKKNRLLRSGRVHFIIPPTIEGDGTRYMIGQSSGVCKKRGTSMTSATLVNQRGELRSHESAAAISHELGHLLGASAVHPTDCSLMDYGVLGCSHEGNHFNAESAAQINACMRNL